LLPPLLTCSWQLFARTILQLGALCLLQLACAVFLLVLVTLPLEAFSSFDIYYGLTHIGLTLSGILLGLTLLYGFRIPFMQVRERAVLHVLADWCAAYSSRSSLDPRARPDRAPAARPCRTRPAPSVRTTAPHPLRRVARRRVATRM